MTRPMPATSSERAAALVIMDWAYYSPEAERSSPDRAKEYRAFCGQAWGNDEALWRKALDMALDIWKADLDRRKREVF